MAIPQTRTEFKEYCLRSLGDGVININVSDPQVEDRIDEALKFWADHHYNGQKHNYIAVELTQQMIDDRKIPVPSSVLSVGSVFKSSNEFSSASDWMSIRYQLRFDDVFAMAREGITSYYITRVSLRTFERELTSIPRIDFNQHESVVHIRTDMDYRWSAGQFAFFEVWQAIVYEDLEIDDPSTYASVWGDRILQNLCTAYIKRQWGENLKKFVGVQLAGGVQLNADSIIQEAKGDIQQLESDFIMKYQTPDEIYFA
jgi:hypothetical protein